MIIQDCWVNDSEIRSGEDGTLDIAYRESVLRNVTMKVIDGEWRVWASVDASETSSGYDQCTDLINQL